SHFHARAKNERHVIGIYQLEGRIEIVARVKKHRSVVNDQASPSQTAFSRKENEVIIIHSYKFFLFSKHAFSGMKDESFSIFHFYCSSFWIDFLSRIHC